MYKLRFVDVPQADLWLQRLKDASTFQQNRRLSDNLIALEE